MKSCRAICHRYCAAKERDLPEQIAEIERNDKKTNPQRVYYRDPSSNLVPFDPSSKSGHRMVDTVHEIPVKLFVC